VFPGGEEIGAVGHQFAGLGPRRPRRS
jgi:hypothetical protein